MNRPSDDAPALDPATAVVVGRIVAPHGLKGDVKVQSLSDFADRFEPGATLWLDGRPRRVERSRRNQGAVVLKLEGFDTRTDAEALRGRELMAPQPHTIFDRDRYYIHELIGLDVQDAAGASLGRLQDVLATGANDVYVVRGERGELLLPAVDDVIKQVDVRGGRIVIELLPGLEFQPPPPRRSRRSQGSGTGSQGPEA